MKKMIEMIMPVVLISGMAACAQKINPDYENISYGTHRRNGLDLWVADGQTPRPLLVYIHGGGWRNNDKSQVYRRVPVKNWLAKGVSVASIDYRYSTDAVLPAPVHDAARAIQFLRYKANDYNIDPSRIAVMGGSAGGCSSLWILFHDDLADLNSPDPVLRQSSRVQGAYVQSPQTAIDPLLLDDWIGPKAARHPMIFEAVGASGYDDLIRHYKQYQPLLDEFSPINHLDADDPPVFITYPADLSLPALKMTAAIHHGMFGIKLKEKADRVGYEGVHLDIGGSRNSPDSTQFLESVLLPAR